jgi:hypothetical protein
MSKIGDFLPEFVNRDSKLTQSNHWLNKLYDMGFTGFMKSQYGANTESAAQYYGIEQLYFDWLRQAYAYRRMFIQDLYLLAFDCSEIRTPLLHLKKEIFRKGFDEWHPKFVVRCDKCGINFQSEEAAAEHKQHGLRKPDSKQTKEFDEKWRDNCNIFGQSLESVLNSVEDDLNIVDDLYIHLNKQYKVVNGKMHSQLLEVRRIHPALIEFDLDKAGLPKNSHWICPFHRDDVQVKEGVCPTCNAKLFPAMYIYNHRGGRVYMLENELIHASKFSPHETYGYSPLLTLMQKVLTISGMDRFLYRYFFERKTPTQMILTNTDDPQSLETERARMESKMMEDPTYTPWIAVSNRTGRGRTDVVKLFHTLQEMDYLNVRNEIRDRIAGIYGVPQMYYNVMEGTGGISGQTQQLKMMSNVVASDQRLFNEKIIPVILKELGITDWEITLRTPEEKIEGQTLQLAQQKVAVATSMHALGFDIKLKPGAWDLETMDFSFSGKAMNLEEQQQMMMGGGMGGGMPVNGMPVGQDGSGGQNAEGGVPVDTPISQAQPGQAPQAAQPAISKPKTKDPLEIEEGEELPGKESVPKNHRLENAEYNVPTPEDEEEEEEDNNEEKVWE